jgi:multidrug efflux pump subunit AcrB
MMHHERDHDSGNAIGRWAAQLVHNGHLLGLAAALILIAGLAAWGNLPRIEDPRINTRNALVVTPLPGGDAARVESLVTKKLEDALREVAEIKTLESTSRAGVSLISIELDDAIDGGESQAVFARIREHLAEARAKLPREAGRPELDDQRGAVAYSLIAAVAWEGQGQPPLGILDRLSLELADRLRNLPGTEQVVRFGAADEEIRVEVDPGALAALGLSLGDMAAQLAAADPKLPAGTLRPGERRIQLEVAGSFAAADRVAAVPLVAADGRLASVGDLARVTKTWADPPREIAFADGRRAVLIGVRTRPAVHLGDWAARARDLVAGLVPEAGRDIAVEVSYDQSRYTQERLTSLGGNLLAGAAVVLAVVLLTMGWRAALVVGAALPLAAALTLFGLDLAGQQIHQMSIFGMIIAIGLLIDNAIVMTEEVRTRRAAGRAPPDAARAAVSDLFAPLAASTFTTILGFMPVFLLPGNVGDFVGPIAVAVILALAVSFALSMTLIPALAARYAGPGAAAGLDATAQRRTRWWRQGWSSPGLRARYAALLEGALQRPAVTVLACLTLPAAGFWAAGQLGQQFFPTADRDQFEVQVWLGPGTGVGGTADTVRAMEGLIRAAGAVHSLTWVAGASSPPVYYNQLRDQDASPPYARGTVLAAGPAEAQRLVAVLQDRLSDAFPQARVVVKAFGQGPPVPAPVSLRLAGPDTGVLRRLGQELRLILSEDPAITHTLASIQGGAPKLWLDADEEEARLAGLSLGEIAGQFQAALEGAVGGRVLEDLEDLPVRVRLGERERTDTARVATLRLVAPRQEAAARPVFVPADALGELRLAPEVSAVTRRNGERVNTIQAWIRPDILPSEVTARVQQRLAEGALEIPPGYRLEVAGDSEESGEAVALLLAYAPLLGSLMLATLVLTFRSFPLAGIVGMVGALSLGLGFLSLWVAGYPLGFNPLIGSAGLLGVAINASIVVLAAIRRNPAARAGEPAAIAAEVMHATRHVVSTTLTTVGGFLPLMLAGGDFWPPLAVVIAGGVGLSIVLGLLFTPALYRVSRYHGAERGPEIGTAVGAALR